jgi:enoyl-CoA hydratase
MPDVVLVEVADRIATITLNRPEARNALNRDVRRALPAAITACDERDDVDVMILTGADPAFCAGLDLKELGSGQGDAGGGDGGGSAAAAITRGPFPATTKPVVGAINGVAVTGGFEVALACDFLIASERARFADTHARVGIMPGWGLTVLLPQAVGVRRARELSATGNYLDAETALAWGLVNHVVPHDELLPFCRALAADMVSSDQGAVRRILRTYKDGSLVSGGEAWGVEAAAANEWQSAHFDPAEVERRRQAIVDRGRRQVHAK